MDVIIYFFFRFVSGDILDNDFKVNNLLHNEEKLSKKKKKVIIWNLKIKLKMIEIFYIFF